MTRERFPVLAEVAYLNAGSTGPLATDTVEAMRAEEEEGLRHGRGGKAAFEHLLELRARVRELVASLVHVAPEQVALTASTSDGCQVVLAGLALGPDDEVVTTDQEHFGLLGPLHASGARIRVARTGGRGGAEALAAIHAELGERTRLVACSHVFWTTGNRLPIAELARDLGVPVLVDGAQSVGAIDVHADDVDFLTVSGQKWLAGPEGTGALVVRDPEALRVGRPTYFSQQAHERDGSFTPRPGAARFDTVATGAPALAGLAQAIASLPPDFAARVADAAERARELLLPLVDAVTAPGQSGLVSWADPDAAATAKRLAAVGVLVRDIPGFDLVRASCGWWTDDSDLALLVAALQSTP